MKQFYALFILHLSCTWTMHDQQKGWTVLKEISFHKPTSCVYNKDNKFVIALTNHKFITQYYFASKPLTVFFEYKSPVSLISLSPSEKYLYGISTKDPHCTKRLYTIWSIATKRILHQLERPNFYYHLSPNDTYLITQEKGAIEIRDPQTGNILRAIAPIHADIATLPDPYFAPSFDHSQRLMAIAHKPPTIQAASGANKSRIINLATGIVTDIKGSQCPPAFSSNEKYIATATQKGTVNLVGLHQLTPLVKLKYAARKLSFTPDNRLIITNSEQKPLAIHDDECYPYTQSITVANFASLYKGVEKYDHAIIAPHGNRLCVVNHMTRDNDQGTYHDLTCTLLDPRRGAYCNVRKLYPTPLYMSPHGQYIIIPSYEYDMVVNETESSCVWHPHGRYGDLHFSEDETTIAYQPDKKTVVLLKRSR